MCAKSGLAADKLGEFISLCVVRDEMHLQIISCTEWD